MEYRWSLRNHPVFSATPCASHAGPQGWHKLDLSWHTPEMLEKDTYMKGNKLYFVSGGKMWPFFFLEDNICVSVVVWSCEEVQLLLLTSENRCFELFLKHIAHMRHNKWNVVSTDQSSQYTLLILFRKILEQAWLSNFNVSLFFGSLDWSLGEDEWRSRAESWKEGVHVFNWWRPTYI